MTATVSAPASGKLFVQLNAKGQRIGYTAVDPTFGVVVCPIAPYEPLTDLIYRLKNPAPPSEVIKTSTPCSSHCSVFFFAVEEGLV